MATVINESKIKELDTLSVNIKASVDEFLLENTLATKKQIISSSKKARSLSGTIGKMMKEYRRTSLEAFDKDPKTKAKMKEKREARKAAKDSGEIKPSTSKSKKKKK